MLLADFEDDVGDSLSIQLLAILLLLSFHSSLKIFTYRKHLLLKIRAQSITLPVSLVSLALFLSLFLSVFPSLSISLSVSFFIPPLSVIQIVMTKPCDEKPPAPKQTSRLH